MASIHTVRTVLRCDRRNCKGTSLPRKVSSLRAHLESILLGSDDDLAERVVFDGIARIISQVVGATQFLPDWVKVGMRVDDFGVKGGATGFFCDAIHPADSVFIAGRELAVFFLRIADGEQYNVHALRGFNRRHHVVRAGVIFAVAEDQEGAPSVLISQFFGYGVKNGIVKRCAEVARLFRTEIREMLAIVFEAI